MKKQLAFVMASGLAVALGSNVLADGDLIYDNDGPDGHSGLSSLFGGGFDAQREIADDFVLGAGPGWLLNGMTYSYIWGDGAGLGLAGDFLLEVFADDAGGGPGTILSSQVVGLAAESLTGAEFFGRPEIRMSIKFAPVTLAAETTYWIAMTHLDAPQNGFILTSHNQDVDNNVVGEGVYIRFPKFGFPDWAPGAGLFGDDHDLAFTLQGEVIPAPGAMALLGIAGLAGMRRRRRK
ncbi:MAG: PEP-CTERM sorting domain-containing protein [Phycisphaerales bacterium]